MNASSCPNSMSLPNRLCECNCEVVVVQDLLQCGVVQLEGANRKAYCLFFKKDFLSRNQGDQKLSTQAPVGTKLLANAKLIKERSVIPFLATSIWEMGANRAENEFSKLFSSLESQEIEQYNMFSRDLEWFLPRDDCFKNDIEKGVTDAGNESNNKSIRAFQGQPRNRSPKYRHNLKGRSKSRSKKESDRTRSRSPREYTGKNISKTQRYCHNPEKKRRETSVISAQKKEVLEEFSDEKRIKNEINNTEVVKTEGAERFRPSRSRRKSPRDQPGKTESKDSKISQCLEKIMEESSSIKYKGKDDFSEFSYEKMKKLTNETENIGKIKTEATEINYHRAMEEMCENQFQDSVRHSCSKGSSIIEGRKEDETYRVEEFETLSSTTKEIGDSIFVQNSCSKGSSIIEEGEINEYEELEATQDIPIKVLDKETAEMPNQTIQTSHFISAPSSIVNGKGKVLKILDNNYGIAIVLGFGRLYRVLFDIYDVWIGNQICADLGKTLHDMIHEGDLVCLHAVCVERLPMSSTGQQIEFLATAIARVTNIQAFLKYKVPTEGIPSSLDEVSLDKVHNFHQVPQAMLSMQDEEVKSMGENEIPIDIGILWKRKETTNYVNFFCFHCKLEHHINARTKKTSWEAHTKHVVNCSGLLRCLEKGRKRFQCMRKGFKTKQTFNEKVGSNTPHNMVPEKGEVLKTKEVKRLKTHPKRLQAFKEKGKVKKRVRPVASAHTITIAINTPQNMATENQVLQTEEFKRLVQQGAAGKSDLDKLYCFHCQYEGENMSHFTSKNHQDHVRDCGTKILDCPENPELSFAVGNLICSREMLYLLRENMSSSYHRYFCLHCKEPFSDKRHIQGVNHTVHMAKNSCVPTCKFVLLDDGKYVIGPGKGGKWCFICDVKLVSSKYKAHLKSSHHSLTVLNLLKKKASTGQATSSSESETVAGKSSIVNKRTFDFNNSVDSKNKIELYTGSDNLGHKDDSESNFHVRIKWYRPVEIDLPSSPNTISTGKTSREGTVSLEFHGRPLCRSDPPLRIPLESSTPRQDPRLGKAVATNSEEGAEVLNKQLVKQFSCDVCGTKFMKEHILNFHRAIHK